MTGKLKIPHLSRGGRVGWGGGWIVMASVLGASDSQRNSEKGRHVGGTHEDKHG